MNYPLIFAGEFVLAAIFFGLISRRRLAISYLFLGYLVAVFVSDGMMMIWPDTFYRIWFYVGKQGVIDALKMGFVLEIAFRTFRVFPGARRTASVVVAVVLALGSVSLLMAPWGFDYRAIAALLSPRVGNAVLWTIVSTLLLARYYNVPVHPLHRNILLVLGLYQTLFGGLLTFFHDTPFHVIQGFFNKVEPVSYVLASLWWAYFVWQPETEAMREHSELVRRVEHRAWAA